MSQSQSQSQSPSTSAPSNRRPSAPEARVELLDAIKGLVGDNQSILVPTLRTSLVKRGKEFGFEEAKSDDAQKMLRVLTNLPLRGQDASSVLDCLRAVEKDMYAALRERREDEVEAAKAKTLAANEKGHFGAALIEWQAALALHVLTDKPAAHSFALGASAVRSVLSVCRDRDRAARLRRFDSELEEAKKADRDEAEQKRKATDRSASRKAAGELAGMLDDTVLPQETQGGIQRMNDAQRRREKNPAPAKPKSNVVKLEPRQPQSQQPALHEQSSVLGPDGKLRNCQ